MMQSFLIYRITISAGWLADTGPYLFYGFIGKKTT